MLKKSERLDRRLFTKYFAEGRRTHGDFTTIITSPKDDFLCAVVVGKKVSKKAVERNSIRRRIYHLVEKIKAEKNLTGVYIVLVKPGVKSLTKKELPIKLAAEIGRVLK
jgi:ribonuclease P protein component